MLVARIRPRRNVVAQLTLVGLMAVLPLSVAQAYVDPNSAGPLYQLLFPMLVAIGSAITVCRRALRRVWLRLLGRLTLTRGATDAESPVVNEDEGA